MPTRSRRTCGGRDRRWRRRDARGSRGAPRCVCRPARRRPGDGVETRPRQRASAREGRGGVPPALRAAPAALRRGRRRARRRRRRRDPRRRRRARRGRGARTTRRARRAAGRARDRARRQRHSRRRRAAGIRIRGDARVAVRRAGEADRRGRAPLARPPHRPQRDDRRARRRLAHRRRRLRGGDIPPRYSLGARADDADRAGRRSDRRQDRGRPPGGQEPRRRLPLAGAHGDRPHAARDASARTNG